MLNLKEALSLNLVNITKAAVRSPMHRAGPVTQCESSHVGTQKTQGANFELNKALKTLNAIFR